MSDTQHIHIVTVRLSVPAHNEEEAHKRAEALLERNRRAFQTDIGVKSVIVEKGI